MASVCVFYTMQDYHKVTFSIIAGKPIKRKKMVEMMNQKAERTHVLFDLQISQGSNHLRMVDPSKMRM